MAETVTKLPIKQEKCRLHHLSHGCGSRSKAFARKLTACSMISGKAFGDHSDGRFFTQEPSFRRKMSPATMPAVDVIESEKAYEVTAELPGIDEKNIEVKVADGVLTIKGEKREEKEEKKKDYYLQERSFGSFERSFGLPEGVDADKIEANFKKGVLTVMLPKKPEAQKLARKIEVKAA